VQNVAKGTHPPQPIHQSDPDRAPDSDFEPGELHHLVPGNTGRMLDARRTPVAVRSVGPDTGVFEVEVLAFEDTGARWTIEAERVSHFQFERGTARADAETLAGLVEAVDRFDRPLHIPADVLARARTEERLLEEEKRAAAVLADSPRIDLGSRVGDQAIQSVLHDYLAERGLAELETMFAERYASNPSAGELVKGHGMVIARLGLAAYDGKIARDPNLFAAGWSETRRAEHVVARLGFVRAMFHRAGYERVWLYRGLAAEKQLSAPAPRTFVSATFDRAVGESLATREPASVVTALWGQLVPVERIFMTFVETAGLDRVYHEAEAVLLADPENRAF
jgi:hypothetical protein